MRMISKPELAKYMNSPGILNENTLEVIGKIKEQYPFFQTAHLLLIKNLKNVNSPEFGYHLHMAAAYVTDRKILYELIHAEEKNTVVSARINRPITEDMGSNISNTLESQLDTANRTAGDDTLDFVQLALNIRKEYGEGIQLEDHEISLGSKEVELVADEKIETVPIESESVAGAPNTPEELLVIDESGLSEDLPLTKETDETTAQVAFEEAIELDIEESSATETEPVEIPENTETIPGEHSFNDWLKIVEEKEDDKSGDSEPDGHKRKMIKNEIIDRFIQNAPKKIVPNENIPAKDISEESVKEHEGFITDTLAKIYIKQGYYNKAIVAYEKLILKYPEKRIYFADQINEIKNIIKNL